MEWRSFTNDQIEEILGRIEQKESESQALKLDALEELDRRQVFTADGSRNLSEWYAACVDVSQTTARSLVQTMRRTQNKHGRWRLRQPQADSASREPATASPGVRT